MSFLRAGKGFFRALAKIRKKQLILLNNKLLTIFKKIDNIVLSAYYLRLRNGSVHYQQLQPLSVGIINYQNFNYLWSSKKEYINHFE